MEKQNRIYYFSYLIILISGIFYFIDLLAGGKFNKILCLTPNHIYENSEIWRLFTYPLSLSTIEGILLSFFVFLVFAPKLENIYHSILFPIIIASVVFFQALIYAIFSWNSNLPLQGLEGISFFIITLFTLLNIRGKLIFFNKSYINTPIFTIGLAVSWLTTSFLHSLMLENFNIIFSGLFSMIYGVSTGMFAYLHIRYTKIINPKYILTALQAQKAKIIKQKLTTLAKVANEELNKINHELVHKNHYYLYTPNEEKLNQILDKINEKGFNSLTIEEKIFLDEYSKTN